jgi:uncharacterized protein (DUF2236 family)
VHATLLDTYVRAQAHFGTPMTPADIPRFYTEYRGLGRLIGVREQDLPETWPEFCTYFRRTARTKLVRTESFERVLATIDHVDAPPARLGTVVAGDQAPIRRAVWLAVIGLLEPAVRRRLGLRWTTVDEAQFRVLSVVSRGLGPVMPASLKVMGPEHLRWRTAEIEAGPLGRAA